MTGSRETLSRPSPVTKTQDVLYLSSPWPRATVGSSGTPTSKREHLYAYYTPDQLKVTQADSDAVYRWNSRKVANHFCSACGCDVYADSPAFEMDGSWDGKTRRIAVNARLLDDFEAADWPVTVIDGKNLW